MNLFELLDVTARRSPDKAAFIEGDAAVSYGELLRQVQDMASQLRTLGWKPGCRVGLWYPNSVSYVVLTYALWRVDAAVIPLPTECTTDEILDIAKTMQLEAIVGHKPFGEAHKIAAGCFHTRLNPEIPPDNHGVNIAFVRFTSGTTSARKGVALSHESIRDRIASANKAFRIGPDDVVMWCLPMAHHFLITIVLYMSVGATVVLARHVLARPYLEAVNRWKGTILYAAPFHFSLLARDASGLGIPSVRLSVSTTCAMPQDVADDFFKRFDRPLVNALGIIEVGLACLNTDDPRGRWNAVGRPAGDFKVRILEPDKEGYGDVALKGPGMLDAYAAPWMPRDEILRDGWFITGDIGRIDADGFLFLAGRKTAVINLAGRKVFPEEIEAVINRHPDVRESRVYGRTHAQLGEVVEAEVVLARPDADPEAIRAFCRENLASYKNPAQLLVVSALPRTVATGKIRRDVKSS
ncbi:MAG TPA: class I adenylate-forming enzyme family protein [Kiritimatiellia bacterium]|jgi:long-chain acyl-CoA synthetase